MAAKTDGYRSGELAGRSSQINGSSDKQLHRNCDPQAFDHFDSGYWQEPRDAFSITTSTYHETLAVQIFGAAAFGVK